MQEHSIDTINTPENRKLLFQYLTKQTMKEKKISKSEAQEFAKSLIKKYKDNLFDYHGLAWSLGSKSLEYFCMYFLSNIYTGDDKAELAPIHHEIWEEIEGMILHKTHDKQNYVLPRGTGKSSFISLPAAIWSSVYKYKRYTLICSAIGDTAETFIRNIRMALEDNIRIEKAFGKLYDPKHFINNSEKIELANKTMIQSISASSTMRGKSYGNIRIELALLDDYQKDDEVRTDEQRQKKWKRFNDDVNYAMQKDNSTIIAVGTLQHKECFYSRLKSSPIWKTRHEKGVLVDDIDELFNSGLWAEFKEILFNKKDEFRLENAREFYFQYKEEMQYPLLWQSYWDCLELALQYYGSPNSFKQEVQGDVNSIGQKVFTTIITKTPEEIDDNIFKKTMLCVDPAGIQNKNKSKSDFFAFATGSIAENGVKYIRKGEILKFNTFDEYLYHVIGLLKKYDDITHVYVEKQTYSALDVQRMKELISKDDELKHRNLTWINENQTKNKDEKISTIASDINLGRVIFNEEDEVAIQQLQEFAGCQFSLHDDFPDIVAECVNRLDKINVIKPLEFFDRRLLF